MYWTILRRELLGRKRQTIVVAAGLAIAIALVIVVSSLSAGVRQAQNDALAGVYGVGTDITVTGATAEPGSERGPRFDFGSGDGATNGDGTTELSQSRLTADPSRGTLDASSVTQIAGLNGVQAATGALSLTNVTFSGQMPNFDRGGPGTDGSSGSTGSGSTGSGASATATTGTATVTTATAAASTAAASTVAASTGSTLTAEDSAAPPDGGSSFGIESFTVLGVDPSTSDIGPLSATTVAAGRAFTQDDAQALVALVDQSYAESNSISVGGTITVAGKDVTVVGLLASTTDDADTAANVFLPLETARTLSSAGDVVSTIYVSAGSASDIDTVQSEITAALPDATVSSQADLASQISGSLSSAASLITSLGTWLSIIVLAVALAIAMLLTSSGVSRRTREFGTLKAIGWSNKRLVGQLAGESAVQALIGGAAGLVLGLGAIGILNLIAPTLGAGGGSRGEVATRAAGSGGGFGGPSGAGPGGSGPGGDGGGFPGTSGRGLGSTTEVVLHAPVTLWIVLAAVGLTLLGGLLAGSLASWRAARLSPAEALRSVS